MRFSAAVVLAAVGAATAQQTCDAQNIVDSCLTTTSIPLENCPVNDWQCMCDAQTQVVTCYNNCPNDPNRFSAEQSQTSWCNAAKQFAPSSSSKASTMATATATSSSSSESSASAASASASASSTGNAAAGLAAPVSGLLAVALGFVGLL